MVPPRAPEQIIEGVDRPHELHASLHGGEPLVDFQERHHVLLIPQIPRRGDAVDVPFHGLLEQDRRQNARAIKRRAGQHTGPHGMDQVEHLGVGAVAVPPDAVLGQRLGRATAALVKGSEKTAAGPDLLRLGSVHPSLFWHQPYGAGPRDDGTWGVARPHLQALRKFTGLRVREELEHPKRNLPRVRQHLVGARHARSPVTLRKKTKADAQVSGRASTASAQSHHRPKAAAWPGRIHRPSRAAAPRLWPAALGPARRQRRGRPRPAPGSRAGAGPLRSRPARRRSPDNSWG